MSKLILGRFPDKITTEPVVLFPEVKVANTVDLRSKSQILGQLYRDFLINTDLTAVAPGSDLAILLEAIAQSQSEIEISALNILENTNLESLVGNALDKKAESIRIPNGIGGVGRQPATQATGPVVVKDSTFNKISTKLYAGKPAPFSGATKLYVEDANLFPSSGPIYIGRGTADRFEGPISYSSVTNDGSFWTINLSDSLSKSHLYSDVITLSQGGDRVVPAGTVVQVPANNESPAIQFTTISSVTLPDGEDTATIKSSCNQFGETGNALAGSITQFVNVPFTGATVSNTTSFQSGKSSENDEDLRERIRNYPSTLSRGTRGAIEAAVRGATDPDTGRSIQSVNVLEPVEPGDFARVYIDDNSGLEPSYEGQPYELLLNSASGQETTFGAAQFPIAPATAIGTSSSPFVLNSNLTLQVQLDETVETFVIDPTQYSNINSASGYEIARDLNTQSNLIGVRTIGGGKQIVISDLSGKAEFMKIFSGEWQKILGLPVSEIRPLFLYKNSELLSFRGKTATLVTRDRNLWNLDPADLQNVRVKVDGVTQTFTIVDTDFAAYGTSIDDATVIQWAEVLSTKIAGVKFTVSGQALVWSTWQEFSDTGTLEILESRGDDTPATWIGSDGMWTPVSAGGTLSDVGRGKDYKFNRFTGEITLINKPNPGDKIEIATRSTRAFIDSAKTPTGQFAVAPSLDIGNARFVVGFDGAFALRDIEISSGTTLTASEPDPVNALNVIRLTANSVDVWNGVEVGDWMYLIEDLSAGNNPWGSTVEGFYRIKAKGFNVRATNELFNSVTAETRAALSASFTAVEWSDIITVTATAHGLKTGDLISVTAAATVGGIPTVDLDVSNQAITVLDDNNFIYTAGSAATSNETVPANTVNTSVVDVTLASHGYSDGAVVNTVSAVAIGGISALNLSVTGAAIRVVDANTFAYSALATATSSASGNLTSVTYVADSWIETEISSAQATDWSTIISDPAQIITQDSIHLFKSSVLPQLVDLGGSSVLDVDQIVTLINDQVAAGAAEKVSPQQFTIRSNNYLTTGSAAVLAVIGSASSVLDKTVASAQQAHTAYSLSGDTQGGAPIILNGDFEATGTTDGADGYAARAYLKSDATFTDITNSSANPAIEAPVAFVTNYPVGFQQLWLTGRQYGLNTRVYNNQVATPFTGVARGENVISPLGTSDTEQTVATNLNRYSNFGLKFRDLPLTNNDKLVVEMDLDPTDKTVAIPMHKVAKILDIDAIASGSKGQVISFRLADPEDADKSFFASDSVYKNFDFADFKLLTKSVGLYREDVSDRALVLRSTTYGGQSKLKLAIKYPALPDLADITISHSNNYVDGIGQTLLYATLASDSLIAGSTLASGTYKIAATAAGTLYSWRITAGLLNLGGEYLVGNILNIGGSENISDSYQITAAVAQSIAAPSASVSDGSDVVEVYATGHGFLNGDLVTVTAASSIGGVSAVALSRANTPITFINANTFSYVAGAAANTTPILAATADTVDGSAVVTVTATGHGLTSGDLISVTTALAIGGISPANLSQSNTPVTVLDGNTFTYVAGASSVPNVFAASNASVINGFATVTVTVPNHGLVTGNLVTIVTSGAIGGISNTDLSESNTPVTVIGPNQFSYEAAAAATSNAAGVLDTINSFNDRDTLDSIALESITGNLSLVTGGAVTVLSPGSGGLTTPATFNAVQAPVRSWELLDKTLEDLADAINAYYPDAPIATGEAIGTNFVANPIADATYITYPNASAYPENDLSGAFAWHSFSANYAGSAGIWQYDSSVLGANNIKATCQEDNSIFPTTTDASGTSYSPIGEAVLLVPTNSKTLADWLEFKAASSLNVVAHVERADNDYKLQISSRADGADGAVSITGVNANELITPVIGNATTDDESVKLNILNTDSRSLLPGQFVRLTNTLSTELKKPYTNGASGFFRQTNAAKYVRVNSTTGRFIFYRNGMHSSQTEPLQATDTITFAAGPSADLIEVSTTGTLSAQLGDMMLIAAASGDTSLLTMPDDSRSPRPLLSAGITDREKPEYIGFPVAHIIDSQTILIMAPGLAVGGPYTLNSDTDVVFLPALYHEKNIRTNKKESIKFKEPINDNKLYYVVKKLGAELSSVFIQNSAAESTDDAKLSSMSVSTDDYAIFGEGFDPSNQGTFRIVAHNGRNHLIVHNPNAQDEIISSNPENGGVGSRKWRSGPIETSERPLRIVDAESVRIGDYLRISSPVSLSTDWFDSSFFGSWQITGMGYHAFNYSGPLPHTPGTGTEDYTQLCPYVEVFMPNAPLGVRDTNGNYLDNFLIGQNTSSIGIVEGQPLDVFRMVAGIAPSPIDPEDGDVFLVPKSQSRKMSEVFGTSLEAWHKIGFEVQAFQGIDGYKVYTGLVAQAHRIVDGLQSNSIIYPGTKAAGAMVEVLTPLIRSVSVSLIVKPRDGVSLNTLTDLIKSALSSSVNGLGVGQPVVISELIRVVQSLPGVFSVEITGTTPAAVDGRIVTASQEKALILSVDDITVG